MPAMFFALDAKIGSKAGWKMTAAKPVFKDKPRCDLPEPENVSQRAKRISCLCARFVA
jgi:hypothetical protein